MKKRRKRKNLRFQQPQQTMIGKIVDSSLEDFERELIEQKVNIGTINNLILNLESVYFELRTRKDALIKARFGSAVEAVEIDQAINGLYAEMIKVEQKITYLKQRSNDLIDLNRSPN